MWRRSSPYYAAGRHEVDANAAGSLTHNSAPVVLHVMQSAGIGGAERHLLTLLPALRRLGWDARFWGFATEATSAFVDALSAADVPVDLIRVTRMRSLKVAREIRRRVRALDARLVHSHLFYADIQTQLALLGTRVPSVRTIHNGPGFFPGGLPRRVYGWAGSLADRTITISEHMARLAPRVGFAPTDRIRVVHHGVDIASWEPPADARAQARHRLGYRDDEFVIVCTSRLIPGKGQDTLIRAFARAKRAQTRLRLVVVGTGPEADGLHTLARELLPEDSYAFTGFVPDVRNVIWAADIFVLPTHADFDEGFGIAALEAAAAHVPIVASDHAPLRELVEDDTTGLLLKPGDEKQLAEALVSLAGDEARRLRLSAAALELVRRSFSEEAMVEATDRVYRELVPRM